MSESRNQPPSDDELREMFKRFQGEAAPSPLPKRSRRRRLRLSLAIAALLLGGAAVASVAVFGNRHERPKATIIGSSHASCIAAVEFEGRLYIGSSRDMPRRGELLGTGIIPRCGDLVVTELSSNGATITTRTNTSPDQPVSVYSVVGLDPADAVKIEGDGHIYLSEAVTPLLVKNIGTQHCWDNEEDDVAEILDCVKSGS